MRILLIEDMAGFAKPIQEFLEAAGHAVTWVTGATRLDATSLTGILASPDADPLTDNWDGDASRLVAVDLAGFELALVDGGLIGPVKDGAEIVPHLVAQGITCVAISGGGAGNPRLTAAGASAALPKELVILALRHSRLNPMELLQEPDRAAASLRAFVERLHTLADRMRKHGRRLDYGFPVLKNMG